MMICNKLMERFVGAVLHFHQYLMALLIQRFRSKVTNWYTLAQCDIFMISIVWNAEKRYSPMACHVIVTV